MQVIFQNQEILQLQCTVNQITLSDVVFEYMLDLAEETRKGRHGLSTRGLLALKKAAQAYALIEKRQFVIADDVQAVFVAVASHRIGLGESETLALMQKVPVKG